ncbi:MAG: Maf family nucleotide pyrophosphatase [Pseudoflavonifractor sp.]|nr:Maf family nucleotide pyrophosphatase [Pseudoflavonifractor sp.]
MRILKNLERYRVLLASASPRRHELLKMLGVDFDVIQSANVDESYPDTLDVTEVASYISRKKAEAYKEFMSDGQLLITADTVVVNEGKVLGKPVDTDHAATMLRSLSDRTHSVITGVTITTMTRTVTFDTVTHVTFCKLDDDEIADYVNNYPPLDKAGAYGIQDWFGAIAVKSIEGSFYNVMGLPVNRLYNELKNF